MLLSTSPLEQFEIISLLPITFFNINIALSNFSLFFGLICFVTFLFLRFCTFQILIIPNKWQFVIETIYSIIGNMVKENVGFKGERYVPIIFISFIIVLGCNLIGMIPYSFTVTSHIAFTFSLSFLLFFGINIIGYFLHRLNFFNVFLPKNTPVFIIPLLVIIEIISYITKVFTLSIRLFANMTSGHSLLKIIAGFSWTMFSVSGILSICAIIPILLLVLLVGLELGIAFLQAYVFALLSSIYLNDVINLH